MPVNFEGLKKLNLLLLVNWIGVPVLTILVFLKTGFLSGVAFFLIWSLIADPVWDRLTGFLIKRSFALSDEGQLFESQMAGEVPLLPATLMMIDFLGTLALPWIVASFFLDWFR